MRFWPPSADPLWSRLDEAFRQIKGVSNRTIARIPAEMAEVGTLTGKESGKHNGRRQVRGGRAGVRGIPYIVAGVVVRIALARKLLVRLNAKARDVRKAIAMPVVA